MKNLLLAGICALATFGFSFKSPDILYIYEDGKWEVIDDGHKDITICVEGKCANKKSLF